MIVEELGPHAGAEWDEYVQKHPAGNCYHLRAWAQVAARAYGQRAPYLTARERAGGPIRGALPLFQIRNAVGRYLTSAMFGGYGAILADGPGARGALLGAAIGLAHRERARHLTLKVLDEPGCPVGFSRQELGEVAILSLAGTEEELLKRCHGNVRRGIRKAQENGLVCGFGPQQLPHFYDVLAENYHRKGTPIYGIALMRELCAAFPGQTEILALWKDRRPISGALVLYHKHTAYVPFCSSRREHFKLFPNYLIYWEVMKRARERGMRWLDFGHSPAGSSSLDFKRRFGAERRPQPQLVYRPDGKTAAPLRAEDPVPRLAIALWKRLPRPVADWLGPWVIGHFWV
jgi:FemAB-related protein (PEP-CTERM system-associated)